MPTLLVNGNMIIPIAAYADGIRGDGAIEISPEHPQYASWSAWVARNPDSSLVKYLPVAEAAQLACYVCVLPSGNLLVPRVGLQPGDDIRWFPRLRFREIGPGSESFPAWQKWADENPLCVFPVPSPESVGVQSLRPGELRS